MKVVQTIAGEFSFNRAQNLRRAYQKHVKTSDAPIMMYEGQELLVQFTKYLVEFLETQFPLSSEDEDEREETFGHGGPIDDPQIRRNY